LLKPSKSNENSESDEASSEVGTADGVSTDTLVTVVAAVGCDDGTVDGAADSAAIGCDDGAADGVADGAAEEGETVGVSDVDATIPVVATVGVTVGTDVFAGSSAQQRNDLSEFATAQVVSVPNRLAP
jgi:hypothetical protein